MTPQEIVNKHVGSAFLSDDAAIREVQAAILNSLRADIQAAIEAEREACAELAEKSIGHTRREIAANIRARSNAS